VVNEMLRTTTNPAASEGFIKKYTPTEGEMSRSPVFLKPHLFHDPS